MAPSFVPLFPSGTVVAPSQNTPALLSSIPKPVSAPAGRESDVQVGESSLNRFHHRVSWLEVLWEMQIR